MFGKTTHKKKHQLKQQRFKKGKHSEEMLIKMAAAKKDKNNPMYGKARPE